MTDHGDKSRRRRRRRGTTRATHVSAPLNSCDMLWEIFLRLPALPSSLLRISLVCKRWRRLAADPDFLLRFRAHHRKAPLLGLFNEDINRHGGWLNFTPVLDLPDRIPRQRLSMRVDCGTRNCCGGRADNYPFHGKLLGCRHGRVLVLNEGCRELLVWDPISGDKDRIDLPHEEEFDMGINTYMCQGAVIGADRSKGHVHGRSCHASPFKVVLLTIRFKDNGHEDRASVGVYSSETGMWTNLKKKASKRCRSMYVDSRRPSTLVGGCLYWWLGAAYEKNMELLEFDIDSQSLSVIDGFPIQKHDIPCTQIIQGRDGGVGVAVLSYPSLRMWDRKDDLGGEVVTWVLRKTINLELAPNMRATGTEIMGYVEDHDALLIKFNRNVFIVQLKSTHSSKLCENIGLRRYHPFTSFYPSGNSSLV